MSNFNNQNDDQIPTLNISYTKKKIENQEKNELAKRNNLISFTIYSFICVMVLILSLVFIIYLWILGPKNKMAYPTNINNGFGNFGLISLTFVAISIVIAFGCKYLGNYIIKDEKIKKILSLTSISFLYLTISFLAMSFYAIPLRERILQNLNKNICLGITIFISTLSISIIMIAINIVNNFLKKKVNIKLINIIALTLIVWIPIIGYSVYEQKISLNGGYCSVIYPLLVDLGVLLLLIKTKKGQIDFSCLYTDIIVGFGIGYMSYVIFICGVLNHSILN